MTKIKTLYFFSISLMILYSFGSIYNVTIFNDVLSIMQGSYDEDILFGSYSFLVIIIASFITAIGLFISSKRLFKIIKYGYFTVSSKKLLRIAGYIFLSTGILYVSIDIIRFFDDDNTVTIMQTISLNLMLALFGFIILTIADMVNIGLQLQSENDLTI